jgi:hypothetical protein
MLQSFFTVGAAASRRFSSEENAMDSSITSELIKRLDALAAKLGRTGEPLGRTSQQARIEAWQFDVIRPSLT